MKNAIAFLFLLFVSCLANAQVKIDRIDPPNWWTGMKDNTVQLLVHGKDIAKTLPEIKSQHVVILKSRKTGDDYLFVDLQIGKLTKPGTITLNFKNGNETVAKWDYELKARVPGSSNRKSFSAADNIYLIMPDRFANGDPGNDDRPGMLEKANRNNPNGRHGGDISGIRNHLDYLQKLGVTAIWNTPLLENNMPAASYHGYAITDFYKTDPRFGNNDEYKSLVDEAHSRGIKIIMDMVFNHFGTYSWMMNPLPQPDWVHQWPEFTRSNFRGGSLIDPYASSNDKEKMLNGWFDNTMADFNQKNEFVAKYLIQNSIWWVEYAGLDGIRMDTYPYSDQVFMAKWMKALRNEYPNFNVVGEVWLNTPQQVAYWLDKSPNKDGFRSNLTNVFDFPLMFAIQQAFTEQEGWSNGLGRLYETLSNDFVYSDPSKLITFLDNHDIDRISGVLKSVENIKMALAFIATTRGIPLVYYGTEALSERGGIQGDGGKRVDFPGGWIGDSTNFFTGNNLNGNQKDLSGYMAKLLNWRKSCKVVQEGRLIHYIPEDGLYVYFRTLGQESVMVVMNNNKDKKVLKTGRFSENLQGFSAGTDVLDNAAVPSLGQISVPGKTVRIISLKK